MVNYLELPIGDRSPEIFRAVIEIPKDGTPSSNTTRNCTSSNWIGTCIRRFITRAITGSSLPR